MIIKLNFKSSPIDETGFERVTKKAQTKTEKVMSELLKIKVKAQCVKALVEEKFETKLKGQEELLSKVDKVSLSAKNSK